MGPTISHVAVSLQGDLFHVCSAVEEKLSASAAVAIFRRIELIQSLTENPQTSRTLMNHVREKLLNNNDVEAFKPFSTDK